MFITKKGCRNLSYCTCFWGELLSGLGSVGCWACCCCCCSKMKVLMLRSSAGSMSGLRLLFSAAEAFKALNIDSGFSNSIKAKPLIAWNNLSHYCCGNYIHHLFPCWPSLLLQGNKLCSQCGWSNESGSDQIKMIVVRQAWTKLDLPVPFV